MKGVRITFNDGRQATYKSIDDAADALRCAKSSVTRMSVGRCKGVMRMLDIKQVELDGHKMHKWRGGRKVGGAPVRVRCIKDDGTIFEAASIREAQDHCIPGHHLPSYLDDGDTHWGWRFESIEGEAPRYVFGDDAEVTKEIYTAIRRITYWYLSYWRWIPTDDRNDLASEIIARVAADYSRGVWREKSQKVGQWIFMRVKNHGYLSVKKFKRWFLPLEHEPEEEEDDEAGWWLDRVAAAPADHDAEDEAMLEEVPDELRDFAKHHIDGHTKLEIMAIMGLSAGQYASLKDRLGRWLTERLRH